MIKSGKLGLAGGIIWGLCTFVCTVLAIYTDYSKDFLKILMSIYPGYDISWGGAFLGLIYGFVDAFIGLWLLGVLYNWFSGCCCCPDKGSEQNRQQ